MTMHRSPWPGMLPEPCPKTRSRSGRALDVPPNLAVDNPTNRRGADGEPLRNNLPGNPEPGHLTNFQDFGALELSSPARIPSPMTAFVFFVFGIGAPSEITDAVVRRITVKVADARKALRIGKERFRDHAVNSAGEVPVIVAKRKSAIPLLINVPIEALKPAKRAGWMVATEYLATGSHDVAWKTLDLAGIETAGEEGVADDSRVFAGYEDLHATSPAVLSLAARRTVTKA